jgi:hypothetical protein
MSHYDSEQNKIIRWETKKCRNYPGWEEIDCGCCVGIEWGGDYPTECERCNGSGTLFHHKKSGVLAEYPGGHF